MQLLESCICASRHCSFAICMLPHSAWHPRESHEYVAHFPPAESNGKFRNAKKFRIRLFAWRLWSSGSYSFTDLGSAGGRKMTLWRCFWGGRNSRGRYPEHVGAELSTLQVRAHRLKVGREVKRMHPHPRYSSEQQNSHCGIDLAMGA